MKLIDLNPKFVGAGGAGITDKDGNPVPERHGVGVILDCPCGNKDEGHQMFVPFLNPLDGGPPHGSRGWHRTGDDFGSLNLTPSILRKGPDSCGWHGYIRNGEIITV